MELLALVESQRTRTPVRVSSSRELTASLLNRLDALGIIRNDGAALINTTSVEGLAWSYSWTIPWRSLRSQLIEFLTTQGRDPSFANGWLRIWRELFMGEAEACLRHQLQISQLERVYFASSASALMADVQRYSLGQWRYACWAAVRTMKNMAAQHPGNHELLKLILETELPYRLEMALKSRRIEFCFGSYDSLPDCALAKSFSHVATALGDKFWKEVPTLEHVGGKATLPT
ncbi:hypothetical protein OVA13_04365 [Pseudoxanthomonas sp. SL93]|uniref:hypothetical protein n=1 Tax=Pseudoxanthomonas sp. SL93 TaxID=2995142 RepID=UPI00226F9670|nr:hypothetical protein [Pseudoxanthomonas sp. SL93]WAC64022.1 hypothetical protein OVA13_04365 [Pseudoxanthomonas sp. SL93]